jgi:ATP-dependent Clp protease ATP-binding subunit ClpA
VYPLVVFERFDEGARQAIVLAQDEARALKHNYIGTEHILLGLLREEEGVAARVLESLDITIEEVRAQVARIVGQGDERIAGQIPFTPRAKKVLELALVEALEVGHDHIGTGHLLLGLVSEREGVAMRILLDLGATAESIDERVARALGMPDPSRRRPQRGAAARSHDADGDGDSGMTEADRLRHIRQGKEAALELEEFELAARLHDVERRLTTGASATTTVVEGRELSRPARDSTPGVLVAGAALLGLGLGYVIWG